MTEQLIEIQRVGGPFYLQYDIKPNEVVICYEKVEDYNGKFGWHIHHDRLIERFIEPIETRIAVINKDKPINQIPLRLKLMKPVIGPLPEGFEEMYNKYNQDKYVFISKEIIELHDKECPDCPWSKHPGSIFE